MTMRRFLCFFIGHDMGDETARYKAGDYTRGEVPVLARYPDGTEVHLFAVFYDCLRCGARSRGHVR